nr:hypothetical protein [Tanacetum cinerariifolium]
MEHRDMTMKEYVQYETEKALRNAIVYEDALTSELKFSSKPTGREHRDMTMKEYVQYETEKALRNAIVYEDALTSELKFSSKPTVSPQYVIEVNFKN